MSDPVTNVEIEDVLTSIRRLVSENDPAPRETAAEVSKTATAPVGKQPVAPQAPQTSPAEPPVVQDKLVLTPALRVVSTEPDDSKQDETATDADTRQDIDDSLAATLSFLRPDVDPVETDADASQDAEVDIFVPEDLPMLEDAPDSPQVASGDVETSREIEPAELQNDAPEGVNAPTQVDDDEGISLSKAQSLDSRLVQWEHMTDSDVMAFEPDAPGDSDYAGTEIESLSWVEALNQAQAGVSQEVQDAESAEPEMPLETEVAAVPASDVDSDAEEVADALLTGVAEEVEAQVHQAFSTVVEQSAAPAMQNLAEDDSVVMDEQMLREMVNDIVHQELQGALGERITRNVRKLVRREIHRALASHDLT